MAFGATPRNIFNLVVGQGMKLSAAGIMIGLGAAFGLTHVMTNMLVDIKPTDPLTFVAITLIFFLIAAIASWLPARRATKVDPMTALRCE
jgi:putative ABC transport system permease protein